MKTLRDVKVGEDATVVRLTGEGALKRRIMDMGLTKGQSFQFYQHLIEAFFQKSLYAN